MGGYISDYFFPYTSLSGERDFEQVEVSLRYFHSEPVLQGLKIISTSSKRVYFTRHQLAAVMQNKEYTYLLRHVMVFPFQR